MACPKQVVIHRVPGTEAEREMLEAIASIFNTAGDLSDTTVNAASLRMRLRFIKQRAAKALGFTYDEGRFTV